MCYSTAPPGRIPSDCAPGEEAEANVYARGRACVLEYHGAPADEMSAATLQVGVSEASLANHSCGGDLHCGGGGAGPPSQQRLVADH